MSDKTNDITYNRTLRKRPMSTIMTYNKYTKGNRTLNNSIYCPQDNTYQTYLERYEFYGCISDDKEKDNISYWKDEAFENGSFETSFRNGLSNFFIGR